MKKLAVVTSHPIQYNAPLFRLLNERKHIQLKVFYTWGQTKDGNIYDPDFKVTFTWDVPLLDGYEKEFVENISPNPGAGYFNGIVNRDLIQRINNYKPDALLIYGWSFQSHLQVMRYFSGRKKIIFRGDSTLLDEAPGFSLKKIVRRIFLKWVYRHIDVALYTGESNRQYFIKHGVNLSRLQYAPHAVENERFFSNDKEMELRAIEWRSQLHIPNDAFVFLFAGKLEPKKNVQLLVECFMELKNENTRLVIVGNGVMEEAIRQLVGLDQRIIMLGFQNQQMMPVVYRLGDVFILPSQGPGETWGLSVNEAMACGRPVIISSRCGCAADLGRQPGGYVFKSNDKTSLIDLMMKFARREIVHEKAVSKTSITPYSLTAVAESIESAV